MSDWGEDDGIKAEPVEVDDATGEVKSGSEKAFGVDVSTLAGELVDAAIKASVRRAVAEVANGVVTEIMTPKRIASLQERARGAAETAMTEQLDENRGDDPDSAERGGATDPPAPPLYYGSVDEFVREYLRNVYRRRVGGASRGTVWAAEWWRSDEAVIRLEALWRAWEFLRLDSSTGMSVWWRDHADHHMPILLDPNGPFAGLIGERELTKPGEPLPYTAPPDGLFPDVRAEAASPG